MSSALYTAVTTRYSAQRILNVFNPDAPSGTTVDTTRVEAACTDAAAIFETICGVAFDSTNAIHVAYAVPGVLALGMTYLDNGAGPQAMEDWKKKLRDAAKVLGRDRILASTNSYLQATNPGSDGSLARPAFDDSVFYPTTVQPPSGGSSANWSDNGLEDE